MGGGEVATQCRGDGVGGRESRRRRQAPATHAPTPLLLHLLPRAQGGVVLGADTRSTAGTTVADKNCEKIHYIGGCVRRARGVGG